MSDVPLREYVDSRIDALEKRMHMQFTLTETAVAKAERTMNERLNSMNEFRDALKDQSARMATRAEHDKLSTDMRAFQSETISRSEHAITHEQLTRDIRILQDAKANLDGRMFVLGGLTSVLVYAGLWALGHLMGLR